MKIFYDYSIFTHQNLGGISKYFINLEKLLKNQNLTKIFAPIHRNLFLKENIQKGIFIKRFPKYSGKIIKFYNQLLTNINVRNFNPDIYHKTYYNDFWPSNLKGKKIITVYDLIHEIYHEDYGYDQKYRPKEKCLLESDVIIAISKNTKNDLINYYDIPKNKIYVTHLGVNLNENQTFNKKIVEDPYLLYVGDRKRYKNFSNLLKAFSLNTNIYKDFKLVVFGGEEFSKSEIEIFKDNKIDLNKIFKISGNDKVLSNLYEYAELFIFPSKYEGFGLPLIEAGIKKCPIACSNIKIFKEIMGDSVCYFNPDSPEDISKVLEEILYSNEKKKILKEKAFIKSKNYSWKKCSEQTFKIYKSII